MSVWLEPEFLLLIAMIVLLIALIVATIVFAAAARRRRVPHALVALAAINLFCGGLVASLGTAHLLAVVGRALAGKGSGPGGTFVYDFRFYSLVLLGVLLLGASVACVTAVRSLARGEAAGRRVTCSAAVMLLALNVPLMPIEGFATGFTVFALVNLVAHWCARRHFHVQPARAAVGHLSVTPGAAGGGLLI
jgi:hypothetical protein